MQEKLTGTLLTLCITCLLPLSAAYAERTDTITLVNGNTITGEILSLEFGRLRYGTDSMGTVSVDWEDVVNVRSDQDLQVELSNGTRYFGHLERSEGEFPVQIRTASGIRIVTLEAVVRITPIDVDESLLNRLDGNFSFGVQTQKSSQVTTSNLASDVSYRARTYLVGLRLNSSVTNQPNEPTTARQNFGANFQRFRPDRWFTDWFSSWERSDELGIDGRTSAGVAVGRYLTQTNFSQLSVTAGIQGARTNFVGEDASTTEAEGRLEIRYLHRDLVPESSIRLTSTIYPLLEDFSKYRAETDLSLRRELFTDLFLDFSIGFSYISDPPTGAQNSDYTATTSVGYSF